MKFLKFILSLFSKKKEPTPEAPKSGGSSVVFTSLLDKYYDVQVLRGIDKALVFNDWGTRLRMELVRVTYTKKSTIGIFYANGAEECYSLEDHDRLREGKKKIKGITAIPEGTYTVKITYSPKFKRRLPLLYDVKGFTGIRIHPGTTDKDTAGCLLVGRTRGKDFIGQSVLAFNKLFKKIDKAQKDKKKITITVRGKPYG